MTRPEELSKMSVADLVKMIGTLEDQMGRYYALYMAQRGELLRHVPNDQRLRQEMQRRIEAQAKVAYDELDAKEAQRVELIRVVGNARTYIIGDVIASLPDQGPDARREAVAMDPLVREIDDVLARVKS